MRLDFHGSHTLLRMSLSFVAEKMEQFDAQQCPVLFKVRYPVRSYLKSFPSTNLSLR